MKNTENLTITHPNLAKEWHPTKNGSLFPTMVTKGQNTNVWWLGTCGHEWLASIHSRSNKGAGCPYCSNKKVLQGYNDLATTNSSLAKEWHPTKNGSLFPTMVTKGSALNVWWLGTCGHEWLASINNRSNMGAGCPYCSNKKILQGYNDLTTTNPSLAKEWHPIKNGNLLPTMISQGYCKKVWWLGKCGHEWQQRITDRTSGVGCPYCSNKKVLQGYNDLATTNPSLAKEWHPTKNGKLTPQDVMQGSAKKVWWLCGQGHEYQAKLNIRSSQKTGCPYCSNQKVLQGYNDLTTTNSSLAKEWHPTKNGNLLPTMVTKGSKRKVWWLGKCGHEWQQNLTDRTNGAGCPYCSNKKVLQGYNDLATTNPSLAKEWHPTKNGKLTPQDVMQGSAKKVWWLCGQGHEYQAKLNSRSSQKTGCPYCSSQKVLQGYNDLATTNSSLAKEWHPTKNGNLLPTMVTKGSNRKVWWLCENGHVWRAGVVERNYGSGCPYCCKYTIPSKSKAHKYVIDLLETSHIEYVSEFRHTELKQYPYDIYLPTKNCLIEIDGEFHYRFSNIVSLENTKRRDDKKTEFALMHNIPLLRIPTSIYNNNPKKFRYYINEFIDKKTIHKDVITAIQLEEQRNPYGNLYLETLLHKH